MSSETKTRSYSVTLSKWKVALIILLALVIAFTLTFLAMGLLIIVVPVMLVVGLVWGLIVGRGKRGTWKHSFTYDPPGGKKDTVIDAEYKSLDSEK